MFSWKSIEKFNDQSLLTEDLFGYISGINVEPLNNSSSTVQMCMYMITETPNLTRNVLEGDTI